MSVLAASLLIDADGSRGTLSAEGPKSITFGLKHVCGSLGKPQSIAENSGMSAVRFLTGPAMSISNLEQSLFSNQKSPFEYLIDE